MRTWRIRRWGRSHRAGVWRDDPGNGAAAERGGWFEGGSAIRAHVVVAAVGRAAIENVRGGALRAGDGEFAGLDHGLGASAGLGGAAVLGVDDDFGFGLKLLDELAAGLISSFFSNSGRNSSKVLRVSILPP